MDLVEMTNQGRANPYYSDGILYPPKEKWLALRKLWARPSWARVWIIRELSAVIRNGPV